MSNESTIKKIKAAETVHPGDSASQVSSNVLHDPNQALTTLSAKELMQLAKMKSDLEKGSVVDNSMALVPTKAASSLSRASSKASSNSASKAAKSTVSSASNASKAKSLAPIPEYEEASEVSKASSAKDRPVSKASSRSARSSRSKALVRTGTDRKVSPLANELKPEDLDDIYSISIHERGPLANMPSREELIAAIISKNPHLDVDEASVIIDNQLAVASSGASQISRAAPKTTVESAAQSSLSKLKALMPRSEVASQAKSSVSNASSAKPLPLPAPSQSGSNTAKSLVSKTSSVKSDALKLVGEVEGATRAQSSLSSVAKGKRKDETDVSSALSSAVSKKDCLALIVPAASAVSRASSAKSKIPKIADPGVLASLAAAGSTVSKASSNISTADLLALAEMRKTRESQRAQAIANYERNRQMSTSEVERNRMAELELARQSLEDSRTLSQLQQLGLHDSRMKDLARHAHEEELSALQRAEAAEADKRSSQQLSALKDREAAERTRLREKRGDIAREERRRQADKTVENLKEYERMDHERTLDQVEGFTRMVEASTPVNVPIPRRTGLDLSVQRNYNNPETGGHGRVRMHVGPGCKGADGDGPCRACGLDPSEHPWRKGRDGSIIGRSGKLLIPADADDDDSDGGRSKATSSKSKPKFRGWTR